MFGQYFCGEVRIVGTLAGNKKIRTVCAWREMGHYRIRKCVQGRKWDIIAKEGENCVQGRK